MKGFRIEWKANGSHSQHASQPRRIFMTAVTGILGGLFVMIVWGVGGLVQQRQVLYRAAAFAVVMWLAILGTLAYAQVGFWRDSITLFRHTLLVAPKNLVAHYNLAHALGKHGNLDEANVHFGEALRIKPDFFDALINMASR